MKRLLLLLPFLFSSAGFLSAQEALPSTEAINGKKTLDAFEAAKDVLAKTAVRIEADGDLVAWGVVVTPERVLTKLSEVVNHDVEFVLPGGERITPFDRLDIATANDLAVFEIPGQKMDPITWSASTNLPQGAWLISPSEDPGGIKVGINAANTRPVPRQGGVLGVAFGAPREEGGIRVGKVVPDGGAYEAGVRPDDYLLSIDGDKTDSLDDAQKAIAKHEAGSVIRVKLLRDEAEIKRDVTLGRRDTVYRQFSKIVSFSGETSRRRTGFDLAIQHDIPLPVNEMGGPLLTLDGRAVGIPIARLNRSEGFALPSEIIQEFLARKVGEPLQDAVAKKDETLSSEVARPEKKTSPKVSDPMEDYKGNTIPPYKADPAEK